MLKIVTAPNPILSSIAKPVPRVNASVIKIVEEMKKTLSATFDPEGVGLAAPQVGKSLRMFLARPTDKSKIQVFINPKILKKTKASHLTIDSDRRQLLNTSGNKESKRTKLEGCLSLLNIWGEVKRDSEVTLQYQLITNNSKLITKTRRFSGFLAAIIQHETDHLDGILFPKRVLEQKGRLYKSRKNEKGEDIFEEIEI